MSGPGHREQASAQLPLGSTERPRRSNRVNHQNVADAEDLQDQVQFRPGFAEVDVRWFGRLAGARPPAPPIRVRSSR